MSSSSSIIPAKKSTENSENKFIRYSLSTIWGLLIVFGLISLAQPKWLVGISSPGKLTEALVNQKAGDILLKKGNYKSAVSQYRRAIKIQPDLIDAYGNLAISYTRLKRYDDAIKIFKYLLIKDNENIHLNYYNLAELYKRKGDINSAIEYYLKSAEISPYPISIYSYQYLGDLYLRLQEWDLAIEAFKQALANKLTLKNSYYGMLRSVEISSPDEPEILETVKLLLKSPVEIGKYDNKIYEKLLLEDKELAKTYNFLGEAYFMNNDLEKAKINFEIANKIWPDFVKVKQNLENLEAIQEN